MVGIGLSFVAKNCTECTQPRNKAGIGHDMRNKSRLLQQDKKQ